MSTDSSVYDSCINHRNNWRYYSTKSEKWDIRHRFECQLSYLVTTVSLFISLAFPTSMAVLSTVCAWKKVGFFFFFFLDYQVVRQQIKLSTSSFGNISGTWVFVPYPFSPCGLQYRAGGTARTQLNLCSHKPSLVKCKEKAFRTGR